MTATHKQLNLSHGKEDFQLKKGLFCLLVQLSSLPAAIRVRNRSQIFGMSLLYIGLVTTESNQVIIFICHFK